MSWARVACLWALVAGCGGPPAAPRYPGELVPTSELDGPDFSVRHRIDGRRGQTSFGFEAVLEKRPDTLVLVALTPFGSRAFAIEQRGERLTHQSFVDEPLPFPPRFVLLDVHRTLFIGVSDRPLPDGEHERTRGGERIVERWRDGRLERRVFERLDADPPGTIAITFEPAVAPPALPERATLRNGWLGYELTITALH
jgi:hypothetical protein